MRTKFLNLIRTLAVVFIISGMLYSCAGGNQSTSNQTVDEQIYLYQVSQAAEQFNQTLPKEEGPLELTEYKFDPAQKILTLTHRFTTENIAEPNPKLIENVRHAMIQMMSTNPDEMDYIHHGISYKFDYYNIDGEFLFTTSITPEDFNAANAISAMVGNK